ncbi:MAG: hypothetical protein PHH11_01070 [Methylomonas sp.]|nr:hypothetical protein [Methylomonas sp.]
MTFKYLTAMRLPLAGMALGLLLPVNASLAASSASADIDWSQFQINVMTGDVSYSPSYSSTQGGSSIYDETNHVYPAQHYDSVDGWSSSLNTAAADAFASAASSAAENSLHANAQSGYQERSAYGYSQRYVNWSLTGSGIIEVSVPYSLSAQSDVDEPGDSGYAGGNVQLSVLYSSIGGFSDSASRSASLDNNFWNQETSRSGLLKLVFLVEGDSTIDFYGSASAYTRGSAPVPVPGAAWLMGSALLGFLSIARRKN